MLERRAGAFAALVIALVAAGPAAALPADARLVLVPGTERFLATRFIFDDLAVEPAGLFEAERLPSGEIFVTVPAGAQGTGTLLAIGLDTVYAWDVCVSADRTKCPPSTPLMTAKAACPDLGERSEDGVKVQAATIGTLKCFEALKSALTHTDVAPHTLRLLLDETPARELYKRVIAAFKADPQLKGIDAAFVGATLRLTGPLTCDQRRRALLHAYRETLGRLSYDAPTLAPSPATPPAQPPPVYVLPELPR